MEIENAIAALSAIGSLAAALWARSSAVSAHKALKIAEEDSASKREDLSVYLIDAMKWKSEDLHSHLSASCSLTNSSSSPTTVNRIEVVVHAIDQAGNQLPIHVGAGDAKPQNSNFSVVTPPINLDPRAAMSGWLSFRLPESIKKLRIERYEIIFHTWSGQRSTLNIYQVKNIQ